MNHFYQTIPQTLTEVVDSEKSALKQEDSIYQFMMKGGQWNAWDLQEHFDYEITSIRRALFNLEKKDKKIVQVGWVKGKKGKPVGSYSVIWQGKQKEMFQ